MAVAVAVFPVAEEATGQTRSGWLLVTPPPVPERRTLMKVYAASSDAEVQAAVASLPGEEQARLVTKVYRILTIPAARRPHRGAAHRAPGHGRPRVALARAGNVRLGRVVRAQTGTRASELRARGRARARHVPRGDELAVEDWTILEGLAACRMSRCVPESTLSLR